MTCQVFLSAKAQRDLDGFPNKTTKQILADCARLTDVPSLTENGSRSCKGLETICID